MIRSGDITVDEIGWAFEEGLGVGLLGTGALARVHILSNEIEAQYLIDALYNDRVDAVVQTYRELAFDGIFIPQRGWGCILTREEDAERAVEIIRAALAAVP
jgi:hypothetical protein